MGVSSLPLALVLVGILGGCATLEKTPQRVKDAFTDPVRREHVITQVGLETTTASVALWCGTLVPFPLNLGVCPMLALAYNFGVYEFLLEPWSKEQVKEGKPSLVGPYWERGPQDGETFVNP